MKKDKKYWKELAKHLANQLDVIEEHLCDAEWVIDAKEEQVESLLRELEIVKRERDSFKNELTVMRQYSIGNNKQWAEEFIKNHKIPVGMDEKGRKIVESYNNSKQIHSTTNSENVIIRWWKNIK